MHHIINIPSVILLIAGFTGAESVLVPDEGNWAGPQAEARAHAYSPAFLDSLIAAKGIRRVKNGPTVRAMPFMNGERLVFDANWGFMNAGRGILSVLPDTSRGMLTIMAEGMTNPFVSTFYRMRDCIVSMVDRKGLFPVSFEEHINEGRYSANRWLLFDHAHGRVFTNKKGLDTASAPPFAHSIASVIFYLRTLNYNAGDSFFVNCFVNKENYRVVFRCTKSEKVTVDAGTFNCLCIEPQLQGKGRVFTKNDKVHIWLTDDKFRMPVLVRVKIAVGSLSLRLVGYERH